MNLFHAPQSFFVSLTLLGSSLAWASDGSDSASKEGRPNIVLILVDDMGYSDLGCYGSEIRTPNIDALAANGVRFTQFYNTAKCYPTRASVLTGQYHQRVLEKKALTRDSPTLAERLGANGYRCLMSGKWHLNGQDLDDHSLQPLSRGFDEFFGTIVGANSYFKPFTLQRGFERIRAEDGFYYTDAITAEAAAAIERNAGSGPFFHYVAYTAPHWPMQIPEDDPGLDHYRKLYDQGWDKTRQARFERQQRLGVVPRDAQLSPRDQECPAWDAAANKTWEVERMAVYAAMLERLDRGVGRIVSTLESTGALSNTLVLFLSDNGGSPEDISHPNGLFTLGGEAQTAGGSAIQIGSDPAVMPGDETTYQGVGRSWANVSNTPFRHFKSWPYDGGLSTPLIVHWPAGVTARGGVIRSQVGHVVDITPTCLDVAGVATAEGDTTVDGVSLRSTFNSDEESSRTLYWEYASRGAMRQGDFKLVSPSLAAGRWELYDLAADRSEQEDLSRSRPLVKKSMIASYDAWSKRVGVNVKGQAKKLQVSQLAGSETATAPKAKAAKAGKVKKKGEKVKKVDKGQENDDLSVHSDPPKESRVLYENDSFKLTESSVVEGDRVAHAYGLPRSRIVNCNREMIRPNLKGKYPEVETGSATLDALYRVALADLEMNIVEDQHGVYFRVSPDFPNMIFTRDTAYASYLGAAYVLPEVVESHLRIARGLRRDLRFKCPDGETIPLATVPNEPEPLSNYEFYEKYGTNAYARRTDDPCWVLGYWKAACVLGDRVRMAWMVDEFEYFDREFYDRFLDKSDGLYFGQASFIDVGGTGYPPGWTIQDSLSIKALSTNCLYVGALDRVARACELGGRSDAAQEYKSRANALRTTIQERFKHPDGHYAYFLDKNGQLDPRREQLGMAFCLLLNVLPESEHAAAVGAYESNDFGSPVFFPFYEGDKVYHNRAIWPFADALFQMALQRHGSGTKLADEATMKAIGCLSRNALWGNFAEVLDYQTGGWEHKHARSYIWSASGYLSTVFHMLAGIDVEEGDVVRFRPHLPAAIGGEIRISGLSLAGMDIDLSIQGEGSKIERVEIDGRQCASAELAIDGKPHQVVIRLTP